MDEFACVFFHVDTGQVDAALLAVDVDVDITALANRQVELGRLEVFRQIGIVIVLAVELHDGYGLPFQGPVPDHAAAFHFFSHARRDEFFIREIMADQIDVCVVTDDAVAAIEDFPGLRPGYSPS